MFLVYDFHPYSAVQIERFHKVAAGGMVAEAQLPESLAEENLSPAELERLRSLGYIK